jgi:hypothetical protein
VALASADPGAINLAHVVAEATWACATIYLAGVLSPALAKRLGMVGLATAGLQGVALVLMTVLRVT